MILPELLQYNVVTTWLEGEKKSNVKRPGGGGWIKVKFKGPSGADKAKKPSWYKETLEKLSRTERKQENKASLVGKT